MNFSLPGIISLVAMIGGFSIMAGIALFIYHVLERERRLEEKEKTTLSEYQDIIKKAHDQAAELLEKTKTASNKVVSEVNVTNDALEKTLDATLKTITDKHIQSLNTEVGAFKQDYDQKLLQMQQAINQNITTTLQSFSQTLLTKTTNSEEMVAEKTNELMQEADSKVAEYKKQRLDKIDEEIITLVQKTCHDILGVTIPPAVHRELIIKALEKSKQEGVFDI